MRKFKRAIAAGIMIHRFNMNNVIHPRVISL